MAAKSRKRPDWSRPLPQPLQILDENEKPIITLKTLGDVRKMLLGLPEPFQLKTTWGLAEALNSREHVHGSARRAADECGQRRADTGDRVNAACELVDGNARVRRNGYGRHGEAPSSEMSNLPIKRRSRHTEVTQIHPPERYLRLRARM